jgi:hypothetical protein
MGWSARALAHQNLEDFGAGRRRDIWGMSDVRSGSWLCENALEGRCRSGILDAGVQATIAAISGLIPTMFMTRVRL